jgi:hypothetical protein
MESDFTDFTWQDISKFQDNYHTALSERQQNFKRQIGNHRHFKCGEQEIECNFGTENIEKIIFSAMEL